MGFAAGGVAASVVAFGVATACAHAEETANSAQACATISRCNLLSIRLFAFIF
jgi:phage/plasmid primase-like uncharacterized protein